jgi:hypothetical protein
VAEGVCGNARKLQEYYLLRFAALWSRTVRNSESLDQFGQSFDSA